MSNDNKNFSQHILSVSSTMLGFSFLVFTSVNDGHFKDSQLIDVFASIAIVLFSISTIFSFLSWRGRVNHQLFETIADWVFITGIVIICASSLFMIFNLK